MYSPRSGTQGRVRGIPKSVNHSTVVTCQALSLKKLNLWPAGGAHRAPSKSCSEGPEYRMWDNPHFFSSNSVALSLYFLNTSVISLHMVFYACLVSFITSLQSTISVLYLVAGGNSRNADYSLFLGRMNGRYVTSLPPNSQLAPLFLN